MTVCSDNFRNTLKAFPSGVTVVTAAAPDGSPFGITISSFSSLSLEPPQILFCLTQKAHCLPLFQKEFPFVVNILAAHQGHLSDHFATPADKRALLKWEDVRSGVHPSVNISLIKEALGHVVCRVARLYEGGDHVIIVGEVIDLIRNDDVTKPLIRHLSTYNTVQSV